MTTLTAPAPWDLPTGQTPNLDTDGTYYGVHVADIGEFGDVIALGHVGAYRMAAALRRHAREFYGIPAQFAATSVDDVVGGISHIWMVNTASDVKEWALERAQPDVSGAFPVTHWTAA